MRLHADMAQMQNNTQNSPVTKRKYFPLKSKVQNTASTAAGKKSAQPSTSRTDSLFNKLLDLLKLEKTGAEQSTEASSGTHTSDPQKQDKLEKEKAKLRESCNNFESMFTSSILNNALENGAIKGYINTGIGEQIFKEMLNEKTVEESARRGSFGIAKILYNQLIKRLVPGAK